MSVKAQKTVSPRHSPSSVRSSENPSNPANPGANTHRSVSPGFEGVSDRAIRLRVSAARSAGKLGAR
jgi:hypothetical protein